MKVILSMFTVLLPLLYLMVFAAYVWVLRGTGEFSRRISTRLAAVTVLVHIVALVVRGMVLDRLPLGTPLEFCSAMAAAMLATYLMLECRWRIKETGFLISGIAFLLQFLASSFGTFEPDVDPLLRDPGFAGHAIFVLLAYTALTLSFVYATLYLVQVRQIVRRSYGLLFRRLPALEMLERMSVGAVELGVPLLFVALSLGHLWMYDLADRVGPDLAQKLTPWDPKILTSWVIFLGYAGGLLGHRFWGWRGRRMNLTAIFAFVTVVVVTGLVHHFVPSFHDFTSLPAGLVQALGPVTGTGGGGP